MQCVCRCTWRQEKRIRSTRTRETGDRESLDTGGGTWTQILWKINHTDSNYWMSNLSAIILLILRLISICYLLYGVLHHTIFQFFEHSFFLPLCLLNSGFLCQQNLTSLHFREFLMYPSFSLSSDPLFVLILKKLDISENVLHIHCSDFHFFHRLELTRVPYLIDVPLVFLITFVLSMFPSVSDYCCSCLFSFSMVC